MNQCPKCNKWTMQVDPYFQRHRCFNANCEWMAMSSAALAVSFIERGLEQTTIYDVDNDVLQIVFEGDGDTVTFDMPDDDGKTIWKIDARSQSVVSVNLFLFSKSGETWGGLYARKAIVAEKAKGAPK